MSSAARVPPSPVGSPTCVHRRLPRSGAKPPGTEKQGFGGWQIPTQICIVLLNIIQCEDWLVVRQWSKDTGLSYSHLISIFKMFSSHTVLAVVNSLQNGIARKGAPRGEQQALGLGAAGCPGAGGLPGPHRHS